MVGFTWNQIRVRSNSKYGFGSVDIIPVPDGEEWTNSRGHCVLLFTSSVGWEKSMTLIFSSAANRSM